jgi:hypothetical protein
MDIVLLVLLILGAKAYMIYRFWKNFFQVLKKDYTFGFKNAQEIIKLVEKSQFQNAEIRLTALKTDELNHTIDCLAFDVSETKLLKWVNQSEKKSAAF